MVTTIIADDSAFFRKIVRKAVEEIGFKVVAEVRNGIDAVEKTQRLRPDLLIMDVIMPKMDGVSALQEIMKKRPTKTLIMSSYNPEMSELAFRAIEEGAIDFLSKTPEKQKNLSEIIKEIQVKSKLCAQASIVTSSYRKNHKNNKSPKIIDKSNTLVKLTNRPNLIIIGASTGGPKVISSILSNLKPPKPPIIIVQHLPLGFSESFSKRLDSKTELKVKLGRTGDILEKNHVYLAPSGKHLVLKKENGMVKIHLSEGERVNGVIPSLDPLIVSASYYFGEKLWCVVLTGMGYDGLAGIRYAKKNGSLVMTQSKESCVIYGMPRMIDDAGLSDYTGSPKEISLKLNQI